MSTVRNEMRKTFQFNKEFLQKVESMCFHKSDESFKTLESVYKSYPVESLLLATIVLCEEILPLRPAKKYKECLLEAKRLLNQTLKIVETELESIDQVTNER